jgi:anaerobic selenocysteine-containing dehydrogenase
MSKRVVHRTCTLCEACCGIDVHVDGDEITRIQGDDRDPLSRGYFCSKAWALKDLHEDPDRLRYPLRRCASAWERLGWDDALAFAAEGIRAVQRRYGEDAVALYQGEPLVHNLGGVLFADTLAAALGAKKRFSANSLDQFPRQLACHWMYGSGLFVPVPDVDRTDYMLIIGANPVVSNGSLMTAPGMETRLLRIRERGGRVVVVDPRRTETAEIADEHHFVRPGTDALLVAALLHTLFAAERVAPGRLAPVVQGLDAVRACLADLTADAVCDRVGIDAHTIRAMALSFADAPSAVCYGRMGTNTVPFGTTTSWLIDVLNIVTGNLDRPGGAMFPQPAVDIVGLQPKTQRGRWASRTRATPEFMGELPAATLAEEIDTPGDGQIRALVSLAGNPVLSSPAGHRLSEALQQLEFMVSIDFYRNETTRHANVILPPVGPLQRDHFDVVFDLFAVRNTARWSPAVFEPDAGGKDDADILLSLAGRLFRGRGGSGRATALALRAGAALGGRRCARLALDLALRAGPYGSGLRFWQNGLRLKTLRRQRHGIDLGALRPCLPDRLPVRADGTASRIDLAPEELVADLARLRESLKNPVAEMTMIGRRERRTVNSWSHNLPSLVRGRQRCVLHLHPDDARLRHVADGDRVRVTSRVGAVELPVELTDDVMPGVVCLPHGYGHHRDGMGLRVAEQHAGVSANDLTDPAEIDPLSGNAVLNGVPVDVEPCALRSARHGGGNDS